MDERNEEELDRGVPAAPETGAAEDSEATAPDTPPETSDHPSHEEEVGGAGAEDPDEMADEDRYRKGPGW
jgi:hypothetical protein